MPFWQTAMGGTAVIDEVVVQGAQNIYFAELALYLIFMLDISVHMDWTESAMQIMNSPSVRDSCTISDWRKDSI